MTTADRMIQAGVLHGVAGHLDAPTAVQAAAEMLQAIRLADRPQYPGTTLADCLAERPELGALADAIRAANREVEAAQQARRAARAAVIDAWAARIYAPALPPLPALTAADIIAIMDGRERPAPTPEAWLLDDMVAELVAVSHAMTAASGVLVDYQRAMSAALEGVIAAETVTPELAAAAIAAVQGAARHALESLIS